jgi:hypothetical protein
MGAGKWPNMRDDLNPHFTGADIVIIADHDDPGRNHAQEVAAELEAVAARARVLDLGQYWAECPTKGDVSDFFAAGHAVEELNTFVEQLPDWTPMPSSGSDGTAFGHSWHWIWHGEVNALDMRKYLIEDLLPEIGVALIPGQWGTYKTFVTMDLSASVMTGAPFIRFPVTRKGGVLFIACEGRTRSRSGSPPLTKQGAAPARHRSPGSRAARDCSTRTPARSLPPWSGRPPTRWRATSGCRWCW